MATTAPRDARRRRIVDRGSDRLALITGRLQTLPSSSSSESHHSYTASCPPSLSEHDLSDQITPVLPEDEQNHKSTTEAGQLNDHDGGTRVHPFMRKCDTIVEASRPSSDLDFHDSQPFPDSPTVHTPLIATSSRRSHFEPQTRKHNFFTPSQITSAFAASQSTRIYCSLAAAISVVLSYVGLPILGSHFIKSIVLYKPLYLLLLTNISIVLACILLGKQRETEKETNSVPSTGEFDFADQLGRALELGLLLQNTVGALFMDCSVYSVVVVCGLSLAQKLGS